MSASDQIETANTEVGGGCSLTAVSGATLLRSGICVARTCKFNIAFMCCSRMCGVRVFCDVHRCCARSCPQVFESAPREPQVVDNLGPVFWLSKLSLCRVYTAARRRGKSGVFVCRRSVDVTPTAVRARCCVQFSAVERRCGQSGRLICISSRLGKWFLSVSPPLRLSVHGERCLA
jgi:hypothetical protein